MKLFLKLFIALVILDLQCGPDRVAPAYAQPYPRTAVYAGNQGGGAPLVNPDGSVNDALIRQLARHDCITLDVVPWFSIEGPSRTDVLMLLRRYNPQIKIGAYRLITHWYLSRTFVTQPSDLTLNATWHEAIQATNGWMPPTTITGYEVDWSNRACADKLTAIMAAIVRSGLFDFVFLDYFAPRIAWTGLPGTSTANDDIRSVNFRRLEAELREAGGPGFPILANGGDELRLDGHFREGFPAPLNSFESIRAWQQDGHHAAYDWLQSGTGHTSQSTEAAKAAARYNLGVACLFGTLASFGPDRRLDVQPPYHGWWFEEFGVEPYPSCRPNPANTKWLGEPWGPARQEGAAWLMYFAGGAVLVNPSDAPVSVAVGEGYQRIRGTGVNNGASNATETVPPRSALFLVAKMRRP